MIDSKSIQIISTIQKKLLKWLSYYDCIAFPKFYNCCKELISLELGPENNDTLYVSFNNVVLPLVKCGIIEHGYFSEKRNTVFLFIPHNAKEAVFLKRQEDNLARYSVENINYEQLYNTGKRILKSLPSIKSYIESSEEMCNVSEFRYKLNIYNSKLEVIHYKYNYEPGIYKVKNLPYYPYYLVDVNGKVHELKSFRKDIESFNYAYSYNYTINGKSPLIYDSTEKTLMFKNQRYVPALVFRAMCMIDPDVFCHEEVYIGDTVSFHFDDKEIIKELSRIYRGK